MLIKLVRIMFCACFLLAPPYYPDIIDDSKGKTAFLLASIFVDMSDLFFMEAILIQIFQL